MVELIKLEFLKILENSEWMDEVSRVNAKEKVSLNVIYLNGI